MIILGIDTSCDDTCISILKVKSQKSKVKSFEFDVLSNVISSQVDLHQKYGGVYPSLAKREHQKNLPFVLKKTLPTQSRGQGREGQVRDRCTPVPDAVAVTKGPGLEPCLWTGINFAKELAEKWNVPLIPVNHIEAHFLAFLLPQKSENFQFPISNFQKILPAIALVVSGGHTQLILINGIGKYKIIGETRDDAAGECFDKTARILGLPYPGGPAIAAIAAKLQVTSYKLQVNLPRPMFYSNDYDFSFSGLKTAVLYDWKKKLEKVKKSQEYVKIMAKEIQQSIIDVLLKKTIKAAKDFRAKTIILGGGVAANEELRRQFKLKIQNSPASPRLGRGRAKFKINFLVPAKKLCADNAAMVALAGYFNRKKATKNFNKIKADANLRV